MKKLILTLLLVFIAFPAFAAGEKKSAYDRVMKSGTIRCGYGLWDPFLNYNFEKGLPEGMVVELMENIASKINLKLEWPEETGWAMIPTALNNGRIDVACSTLWNDPARGRLVAFTDPIFYMAIHAYVSEDSTLNIKTIEDINKPNIRVSTQDGDFTAAISKRLFPKATEITLSSTNASSELLLQVAMGKADVAVLNHSAVMSFNKNNDKKLKRVELDRPVTVYGNSFAVSIHEPALKEMLNTAVKNLIQTGEIESITAEFRKKYPNEIILPSLPYEVPK